MELSSEEIIKKIWGYISLNETEVKKQINRDLPELWLDAGDLLSCDPQLYETLIESPEDTLAMFQSVIEQFIDRAVYVWVFNLPESEDTTLSEVETDHTGKLIKTKAMVKRKSDRYARDKIFYYLCTNPECTYSDDTIGVPQIEETIKELKSCPKCKSQVIYEGKKTENAQTYLLEEISIDDELQNPKTKMCEFEGTLTKPDYDNSVTVGSKIEVTGVIKERKKKNNNKQTVISEFYIEGKGITPIEEKFFDVEIGKEEKEQIHKVVQEEEHKENLIASFAPNLSGLKQEKEGVVLSILGGAKEIEKRDRIHTLYIGDPGMGKSELISHTQQLMPRTNKASGEGASGVGLTATVTKDENSGQWMPEAGAIVKSNKGFLVLDELDKTDRDEATKLNNGMEHGKIYVDKAGVSAEMNAYTTVIASANPKNGKFKKNAWDTDNDYASQITLNSTLLSRFDLVFIITDDQDEERDQAIAESIFGGPIDPPYSQEFMTKFLFYARSKNPKHTKDTVQHLINYYKKLRKNTKDDSILITNRQVAGLKRLSEAHAKIHLRDEVTIEDCQAVIDLMEYSQRRLGVSEITTKLSNKARGKKRVLYDLSISVSKEKGGFKKEDLQRLAGEEISESDIDSSIQQWKDEVEIYESPRGFYRFL